MLAALVFALTITAWNGYPVEEVLSFDPATNGITWLSGYTSATYVEDYAERGPIAIRMNDGTLLVIRPPAGNTWDADDWGPERDMHE